MSADYQKLYAYLVGKIDDALELLEEGDLVKAKPIRELLQNAILRTEEAYIDAAEEEPKIIFVAAASSTENGSVLSGQKGVSRSK